MRGFFIGRVLRVGACLFRGFSVRRNHPIGCQLWHADSSKGFIVAKIVTISGTDYDFDALNETAQKMVAHVAAADARLEQWRADIAMVQLARDVYAKTLVENLPRGEGGGMAAPGPVPVH